MIEGYVLGKKDLNEESDINDLYEEVVYPTYEDAKYTLDSLPASLRPTLEVYEVKLSITEAPKYEEFEVPKFDEEDGKAKE